MTIVKALDIPRKWRLPDVPAEDEWAVKYQVVVPKTYRQEILGIAHETPLAGLPEDLGPFLLPQSKKRCSGILQVVSRPDGWETKSDHSKSTFTVTASHSRTIQQNHC